MSLPGGRQQSAVLDLFLILVERRFINAAVSLKAPINFRIPHDDVERVVRILRCFQEVDIIYGRRAEIGCSNFSDYFEAPVRWLAIMIVRGCDDAPKLLETIAFSKILGPLMDAELDTLRKGGKIRFNRDPDACVGTSPAYFGFWLPSGVGNDEASIPDVIYEQLQKFNEVEALCKEYFGLNDDELLLEEQQDKYFRQRPMLEPRVQYSGLWEDDAQGSGQ